MNNHTKSILSNYTNSKDKADFYRTQSIAHKLFILHNITKKEKSRLINSLHETEILELSKLLDPDELTDVIQFLPKHKQQRIIQKLNISIKEHVDFLLKFTPESAAGIMSVNYILIDTTFSKKQIEEKIESHMQNGKKEPTILVVDRFRHLIGELRLSALLLEKKEDLFSKLRELPTIKSDEDQEECINIFKQHKHEKLVVLDESNNILGLIHAKDLFKVIEQENTEDFYAIAGVHKEEDITDKISEKVKHRLGWLMINMATAFLAAFVVSLFESTISKIVILAAFMPIVAGMGGNAGSQTTAIIVRSLALKHIDKKLGFSILRKEFSAAIVNGVVIGFCVAVIALLYGQSSLFGLVVGLALLANLAIAAIFGTLVPLTLKAFDIDPASSSSVFVTTSTDVFGFMIFLGLATVMLL